jgi:glycosyltransferase involved in cell wall biosynthesis
MTMRASVVVPTFKRTYLLERCLAALMRQDLDPASWEVIVADDAASHETERLLARWLAGDEPGANADGRATRQGPALRYVAVTHAHGPAAARNAGWHAASGEIIAFTDDDTLPEPNWLRTGLEAFADGVVGVSGRIIVPTSAAPIDYERNEAGLECADFPTANCFYRRDALEAVGGFDERFTAAWREDGDLYFTLLRQTNGQVKRFLRVPEAIVVHPVRPARWGVSLGQQRKSMFNALLYKKHPELYRQMIQSQPPWHYYSIVGALMAALGGLIGRNQRLALGAAGVWLLLTGRFCARRLAETSRAPSHVAEMLLTSALIPPLSVYWRLRGALKFRVLFL